MSSASVTYRTVEARRGCASETTSANPIDRVSLKSLRIINPKKRC
jgi:hypothetical protein